MVTRGGSTITEAKIYQIQVLINIIHFKRATYYYSLLQSTYFEEQY